MSKIIPSGVVSADEFNQMTWNSWTGDGSGRGLYYGEVYVTKKEGDGMGAGCIVNRGFQESGIGLYFGCMDGGELGGTEGNMEQILMNYKCGR